MEETSISIKKEILSFTVREDVAQVDIYFEFVNPKQKSRKLTIGFQAPSPSGDVGDADLEVSQITNFKVMSEGKIIPYQLKMAACEDCPLLDAGSIQFSQGGGGVWVYLFEVEFKPGVNCISHTYRFPASGSVDFHETYDYILTTGSKWAGGTIGDLTVEVDMGSNSFFFMSDVFDSTANWQIVGAGKVLETQIPMFYIGDETNGARLIRLLDGKLVIDMRKFKPTSNIWFGRVNKNSFSLWEYMTDDTSKVYLPWDLTAEIDCEDGCNPRHLRLLRNTIYARYGYVFSSPDLKKYFSQFEWYIPDPNLKMEDIHLKEEEEIFVKNIREAERKLKEE